eukprot:1399608-Prymnesium_polylepis.2
MNEPADARNVRQCSLSHRGARSLRVDAAHVHMVDRVACASTAPGLVCTWSPVSDLTPPSRSIVACARRPQKIDLQGADFDVVRAASPARLRSKVWALSMEMISTDHGCEQLYDGQASCTTVVEYMRSIGFEPAPWTPRDPCNRPGRSTKCEIDPVFLNSATPSCGRDPIALGSRTARGHKPAWSGVGPNRVAVNVPVECSRQEAAAWARAHDEERKAQAGAA